MPRTILGKVSLTPKGEYSPDTAYTALDVVSYGGNSWLALQDVTGVAPVEGENWMLLAQKGDQGEQGIQGIQGIQGETGGPGPTGPQGASFTRLEKTAGTGAPGTTDTYTAYNSEGQAAGTVQVYNGMDGTGAGDFKADGTVPMTGDLQMAQHKVTGLADATEDGDAVNKRQMDAGLAERADLTLSNLSNYQKALAAIGGRPRDNLLDNAYFKGGGSQQGGGQLPINQRRKTNYTTAGNAIDRWRLTNPNGTFTLTENGCTLAGTSGNVWIQEYLENPGRFYGEKVTISLLTDEQLIATTGELTTEGVSQNTGFSLGGSNGLSFGFYKTSDGSAFFQIGVSSGNSNTLIAAKLEFGPTQTLAYQDEEGNWQLFETPDYAEELAKCQRYFFPVMERNKISGTTVMAKSTGQRGASIFIPLPCNMRAVPTASVSGTALCELNNGNTQYPITDISTARMSSNVVKLNITCSGGGLTAEKDYPLTNPNTDSYLFLSAEL